ncbi:uncharacterized protein LOC132720911 [Ruditapes philippinarum]|uniref:uncharacterized protein LOC132720911 n=1 Tax=Ruditapes philippinarum TaxID=129788 RepID=UPI00295B7689|nr:uncharacterized protein LOC132720911 [Ruditapes philippinarum]
MCETSDERLYYIRTSLMYTDLTRELLFKVFRFLIKRENITDFLTSPEQQTKLWELSKRNLLNKCDYNLVYGQVLNLERFDISLLIRLILNLCKDETTKPQLGWKTKPLPKDESLGADLLRLRNVRNKIIGHRADAKLSEAEYKQVWAKVKAILLRVIEQVDKDSREDFERRLNEYQQLNIDAEKSKVQRLLNELLQYKKEIDFLQEKVEELIKRSQEFKTYFKTTPERFIRYIKLLFDGGRLVLCGILDRELGEQDLLDFLERNKDDLIKNIEEKYLSCLYPQDANSVNHKTWDVLLLALVLLLMFDDGLSQKEIRNINLIKTARLNYADLALQSLDPDDFLTQWTDLINCLNQLSVNIAEDDKHKVECLIEHNKRKDNKGCNAEEYFKQLKESGVEVKTLTDVYNEITSQLKDTLRELSQKGIKFQQDHVMELKLQTTCENEEIRRKADDLLESGFQASINGSDQPTTLIRLETDKIVTCLTAHPDVTPGEVKQKCILISFKCSTPCGLLHILDYATSNTFQRSLLNIANELHYMQGIVFHLQGNLTLESVSRVIKIIGQETGAAFKAPREETIIPLKCSSIDGIRSVLSAIKQEKTTNSLNKIAEQISAELKETVSLNIVPDLMELQSFLDETDSDESGSFCKNEDEEEILHGVIGDAMDNEQTNFNHPSTASTESNKSKTRSEHSVDKTNETTIHENADKEAENGHIKAVLVDEKLNESILGICPTGFRSPNKGKIGKEKDNKQTNFNLSNESKESNKSKTSSEHTVDKTNEMTMHEHADKEADNSHIKALLANEKLSESILGTPELQIDWTNVFIQLSRSLPATRWKLFAFHLLSNCQEMVRSVYYTVNEIEREAKNQHTEGGVIHAYIKVFMKWLDNVGRTNATFGHIKDAVSATIEAKKASDLVLSIERNPPMKEKKQRYAALLPSKFEPTFRSNTSLQQFMALHNDEEPGNSNCGRELYVRSSETTRFQLPHCQYCSLYTRNEISDRHETLTSVQSNESYREQNKKRKKDQSQTQQPKRSITEKYIIENAKENLHLDFMPIRRNDYDMYMNFVIELIANECQVAKKIVWSVTQAGYCEAHEVNNKGKGTLFVINDERINLCLRKETFEELTFYGNIARPKLLKYLTERNPEYDSTTSEKFMFINFNGTPLFEHMEDKDDKSESNIVAKEKDAKKYFKVNSPTGFSMEASSYMKESEENIDEYKPRRKQNSSDQST